MYCRQRLHTWISFLSLPLSPSLSLSLLSLSPSPSLSLFPSLPISLYPSPSPPPTNTNRAILRLFVVFKLRTGLLTTPSVPSPDRKKAQELVTNPQPPAAEEGEREGEREGEGEGEGGGGTGGKPLAWRATRTGKVIRSIHTGKGLRISRNL